MQKIVVNRCHGGFGLSDEAVREYARRKGLSLIEENDGPRFTHFWVTEKTNENYFFDFNIPRNDPDLVGVVEELKGDANGRYAELVIVEVPDDVGDNWYIEENEGIEHVAERHRTWP